jgi:hypothetical protein
MAPDSNAAVNFSGRSAMSTAKIKATKKGRKYSILLDAREYDTQTNDLQDLDSIRAYDAAKKSGEKPIPFKQAMQEIESSEK